MYQDNLKKETIEFLKKYVYPFSNFTTITQENADDILDFIVNKIVATLVNDQEEGKQINQQLLKMADDAVDDISEN